MIRLCLHIYDWLRQHPAVCWTSLAAVVLVLALLTARIRFKEDISDFLPLSATQQKQMSLYQDVADSKKIVVIFRSEAGEDALLDAVDAFAEVVPDAYGLTSQIDFYRYIALLDTMYSRIPYYLTEEDYARMDSLLAQPDYIARQLADDRQRLMLPLTAFLQQRIVADPLNLYSAPVQQLLQYRAGAEGFTSYDGYMLTEDHTMAFAFMDSPFGASETKQNGRLVAELTNYIDIVEAEHSDVQIHLHGAPVVAVGNASRIKHDSLLAISIAMLLIVWLLYRSIRNLRNMLLILAATGFGFLFATGVVGGTIGSLSLIVVGVASVIIGIAVNYPLHLIVHRQYTPTIRETLTEVIEPLVVGNVTTVGAFLALVPLHAVALRDLGIFCASMLVGTILFCIIYLPQIPFQTPRFDQYSASSKWMNRLSHFRPEQHRWLVVTCLVLTIVFGFMSRGISFDANLSNINYMTAEQRADFAFFASLDSAASAVDVYVCSEAADWDEAARQSEAMQAQLCSLCASGEALSHRSVTRYIPSREEQQLRLARWQKFADQYGDRIRTELPLEARAAGFRDGAFDGCLSLFTRSYPILEFDAFAPMAEAMFRGYYYQDSSRFVLVDYLSTPKETVAQVEQQLGSIRPDCAFDIGSLNEQITGSLSSNFDYIGLVCSLIVFVFLWLSFRNIWLALIAFTPMLVAWLWILGLMHLLGLQFNIVNVILATFIFGQGDDYTIFVTEGLLYEHRTGKPMLPQYKNEIILSALIMFVGIGVLIISRHPAMFSLGAVVLIGMSSVVLMSYLLPPLLFRLYLSRHHSSRR